MLWVLGNGVSWLTLFFFFCLALCENPVIDKITHPVVVPIENLAPKLGGLGEKQTIAAVTTALIDLQDKIGKALQMIQAQHPTSHYPSDNNNNSSSQGSNGHHKGLGAKANAQDSKAVNSKPFVLTEDILGTASLIKEHSLAIRVHFTIC